MGFWAVLVDLLHEILSLAVVILGLAVEVLLLIAGLAFDVLFAAL